MGFCSCDKNANIGLYRTLVAHSGFDRERLLIGVAILLANRIFEDPLSVLQSEENLSPRMSLSFMPRGERFCFPLIFWQGSWPDCGAVLGAGGFSIWRNYPDHRPETWL